MVLFLWKKRREWEALFSSPTFLSKLDSTQDNKLPSQVHCWGFKHRDEAKGKGKIVWPNDLQTLNPWPKSWEPPWELSKKSESNITFGFCLCDLYTCCHSRCSLFPFISIHLGKGGKGGRDESYWGWIGLVIKIKHTSQEFLTDSHYFRIIFFLLLSSLPSSRLSSACTEDVRGSERVRDMLTRGY